jgi:hypothetical protein
MFGHLPEKEAEAIPWDKMCIDLIGPPCNMIHRKGQANLTCKCVTMIGPQPAVSKAINTATNDQSLSHISHKRNGFPDIPGQHNKSLLIVAQNSLDMN